LALTLPDAQRIYAVIDRTWPAAAMQQAGPFVVRDGQGGGSRVSAATMENDAPIDVDAAERAMRALGQDPLFMVREGHDHLDMLLAAKGYLIKDPVTAYAAPIADIAVTRPQGVKSFVVWPPLAIQCEIWADGGIGPERVAVMDRVRGDKTTLLGRCSEAAAGSAFIGIDGDCAMIHALEVSAAFRKQGLARSLTVAAAFWAKAQGATYLTLVTTDANVAANALYTSLGMVVVGHYHYRILPKR